MSINWKLFPNNISVHNIWYTFKEIVEKKFSGSKEFYTLEVIRNILKHLMIAQNGLLLVETSVMKSERGFSEYNLGL